MVSGASPVNTYDWYVPLIRGAGSLSAWPAAGQFESLINEVEYLISYRLAVPIVPSSPGAVQLRFIEFWVVLDNDMFAMAAGGVMSAVVVGVTGIVVVGVIGGLVVLVKEEQMMLSLVLVEGPTMPVP
jgi:hypothetical protein